MEKFLSFSDRKITIMQKNPNLREQRYLIFQKHTILNIHDELFQVEGLRSSNMIVQNTCARTRILRPQLRYLESMERMNRMLIVTHEINVFNGEGLI